MRLGRLFATALVAGCSMLAAATSAGGAVSKAPDHFSLKTRDVAVPPAAKPKKVPVCRKNQKSTKKKPCRKRKLLGPAAPANPPVAGWVFGFSVAQNADETWTLNLAYRRAFGTAVEQHGYAFQLPAGAATVNADLSAFTLDTGAALGQFGAIKVDLTSPGSLAGGQAPFGCSGGSWQTRSGTLTGSIRFVADGTYFKTLLLSSVGVDLAANTSDTPLTCTVPPATCTHGTLLFGGNAGTSAGSFFARTDSSGTLLLAFRSETIGPATISHLLVVMGLPAGDLSVAADASTAQLKTDGGSPWFTGSLTFTPSAPAVSFPNTACGTTTIFAQGSASGTLVAHFAAIPAFTAPTTPAYAEIA